MYGATQPQGIIVSKIREAYPHLDDLLGFHLIKRDSIDRLARETLLKDQSSGGNILWATEDYRETGWQAGFSDLIIADMLGLGSSLIMPRVFKDDRQRSLRTRQKAEVFTSSWVCNRQNNLVDSAWFSRADVFNVESAQGWATRPERIVFPEEKGKHWQDYVDAPRMEIACGEAPYLASRYDTVSGREIPVAQRIGLLDRKLRVVGENTQGKQDWLRWALRAVEACYAYEWQGDSLYLARENLLLDVMEHYADRFGQALPAKEQRVMAYRLSWNLWQMDALKGVIPGSCQDVTEEVNSLTGIEKKTLPCPGCAKKGQQHTGVYCVLRDWRSKVYQRFVDLQDANKTYSRRADIGGQHE